MIKEAYQHKPVLLNEVLEALKIQKNGIYIDATFGRGGHSKAILDQLDSQGRLIAIDKDPEAIKESEILMTKDKRLEVIHGSFTLIQTIAEEKGLQGKINGVLFDLGVSSPQLEDAERGFSFLLEGPLDMRMDNTQGISAADWLATAKENEIANVLYEFGEEKFSRRIARAIVQQRTLEPITTTQQLAEIVKQANPRWERDKHPATRAFQAIRIFINQELNAIKQVLDQTLEILAIGGRLVVISFHSLEDRIVKHFIRDNSRAAMLPPGLPILFKETHCRLKSLGNVIKPTAKEIADNPRSRSAVLRIAEKIA